MWDDIEDLADRVHNGLIYLYNLMQDGEIDSPLLLDYDAETPLELVAQLQADVDQIRVIAEDIQ